MPILSRLFNTLFNAEISRRVSLTVRALDDTRDLLLTSRAQTRRDPAAWKRADLLADVSQAWRDNPLARRIVELTSQYVVGGGLGISADDPAANQFLQTWWHHRLNRLPIRAFEWCDELTRAGELFIVLSTDAAGMSYLRAIPAAQILHIETAENDIEQEIAFVEQTDGSGLEGRRWNAYHEVGDAPHQGEWSPVMLHYAINRPVGSKHGESDLAPLLKWLVRYSDWLQDRARLNHFRQSFLFIVKRQFSNAAERLTRQAELNANPPNPGAILVADEDEDWSILHPRLDSFEASEDGLAMKKIIAAGAGVPLHFLAEPESSTRTTAEQAGGPTFRHYEQRQIFFLWLLTDLARIAVRRAAHHRPAINPDTNIQARGTDIFARDNANLASAASLIISSFSHLRDRNLIDDDELLRLAYRFAGEFIDVHAMLARGAQAPTVTAPPYKPDVSAAAIAQKE